MDRQTITDLMEENDEIITNMIKMTGAQLLDMVSEVLESGTDTQRAEMRRILSEALQEFDRQAQ